MLRTYALDAFISVLVGALIFCLLDLQIKIVFAIIISFLTFFLLTYLRSDSTLVTCKLAEFKFYPPLPVILLCESAIIGIMLIPSFNNVEYVSWFNLPSINLLRLMMSVLISTFLPGYMLFNIIGKSDASKLQTLVFSIVLSLFFTSLTCLLVVFTSGIQLTIPVFITLNLILQTIYLISSFLRKKYKITCEIKFSCSKQELSEKLTLLFLIILQFAFTFSMLSENFPLPRGDEMHHHGNALIISRGEISSDLTYPIGLHTYLAIVFRLSGVPSINAFQSLHFLNVLPILAFYLVLKELFKKHHQKIPILSTFIGFFFGFTWIYAIYLKFSGFPGNLYDLVQSSQLKMGGWIPFYLAPYLTPAQAIGVTSVLLLMLQVFSPQVYRFKRYFLIFAITIFGFLGHIFDVCIFILFFFASLLVLEKSVMSFCRRMAISMLLGLCTVAIIINLFALTQIYSTIYLIAAMLPTILVLPLSFIKEKAQFGKKIVVKIGGKQVNPKKSIVFVLVYAFGLSFITFYNVLPIFSIWELGFYSRFRAWAEFLPWYFYPIALGTAGLLSLTGFLLIFHKREKRKQFYPFLILALTVLLVGRALRLYPITVEGRLVSYLWIPVCVLAGYAVTRLSAIFQMKNFKHGVLFSVLFGAIVSSGMLSSLQYVEYLSVMNAGGKSASPFEISGEELAALNYLRMNFPLNSSVLALTSKSVDAILGFGGTFRVGWSHDAILFKSRSPEFVINTLLQSDVQSIYIASRDKMYIRSHPELEKGYIYSQMIKDLPIAYRNSEVDIYRIPTLQCPTEGSEFGVSDSANRTLSYFPISILSRSHFRYSIVSENDDLRFDFSNILLTHDLDLWNESESEQFYDYLQWIEDDGNLIVFNSLGDKPPFGIGWREENFAEGWYVTPANTSHVLTNNGIITVRSIEGLNYSGVRDLHSPDINVSVNECPYLVIRLKSEAPLHVYPHGSKSGFRYIYLGFPNKWTTNVIDLRNFYDFVHEKNVGFDNDELIDRILIRTSAKNIDYSIDFVRFYKYSGLSNPGFAGLLSLSSGNETIVTGVAKDGTSISFPPVFSDITLHPANLNVTTWYNGEEGEPVSPFVIQKKLGKGQVIYVENSAMYRSFSMIPDNYLRNIMLEKLGSSLGTLLNIPLEVDVGSLSPNPLSYVHNVINASGKITIMTNSVSFSSENPNVTLNLSSGETFSDISLSGLQINDPLILVVRHALIKPSNGGYVTLEVKGNLTIDLPENRRFKQKIHNSSVTIEGESLIFLTPTTNNVMELRLRKPNIQIEGEADFKKARIVTKSMKVLVHQMPIEICGNAQFKVDYSEDELIFLRNFTFNGLAEVPYATVPQLNEFNTPWIGILSSPLHISFVMYLFSIYIIFRVVRTEACMLKKYDA